MISQEQIPAVIDHPVYDSDGHKIGSARHIFYDDNTGYPEWVSVKTGMFGAETFVPIRDAHVVQDHLEVPYAKEKIKEAPAVTIDDAGHLSEQEEHRLHVYYGIVAGTAGTRTGEDTGAAMGDERPMGRHRGMGREAEAGRQDTAMGDAGEGTMAAGAAGAAGLGAAGAAHGMGRERRSGKEDMLGREGLAADRDAMRGGTTAPGGMAKSGAMGGKDAMSAQEAMTRSEEHMHVATERHEIGRARLRKYVVTEEEQQTVPVRHEEVRIVREPITDANRDAALSGVEIGEAEHIVTLHAERPVVEMRTEPVERVRLTTEEVIEDQTVRGQCRKERIEADTIDMAQDDQGRPNRRR